MCACAPVLPKAGGPGPAQSTPMTHISANRAHRSPEGRRTRTVKRVSRRPIINSGSSASQWTSGPGIGLPGWILAGLLPGKHRNRPSGRPSAGRRADFSAFPVAVRPKSGPEGRFPARKHYCVKKSNRQTRMQTNNSGHPKANDLHPTDSPVRWRGGDENR